MGPCICPICGHEAQRDGGSAFPFCSERCRRIDFVRWLDERYRIPVVRHTGSKCAGRGEPQCVAEDDVML